MAALLRGTWIAVSFVMEEPRPLSPASPQRARACPAERRHRAVFLHNLGREIRAAFAVAAYANFGTWRNPR
jgi:hypothetical protein